MKPRKVQKVAVYRLGFARSDLKLRIHAQLFFPPAVFPSVTAVLFFEQTPNIRIEFSNVAQRQDFDSGHCKAERNSSVLELFMDSASSFWVKIHNLR